MLNMLDALTLAYSLEKSSKAKPILYKKNE